MAALNLDQINIKDGGSPAARLWFARLTLARLGLNDGAKLTLAGTDLLCMLNWGTQWTMVSYLKKINKN